MTTKEENLEKVERVRVKVAEGMKVGQACEEEGLHKSVWGYWNTIQNKGESGSQKLIKRKQHAIVKRIELEEPTSGQPFQITISGNPKAIAAFLRGAGNE